jgi:hypothetical protein
MVRGVEIPATEVPTETAINPDDVQAEPRPSRAQRRSKPASRLDNWTPPSSSGSKSRVPPNLTNDLLDRPKSAELEALLEVYTKAHSEGRPFKGLYPLNVRGKMEYELSEMLWVDVPRGDSTEATIFGGSNSAYIVDILLTRQSRENEDRVDVRASGSCLDALENAQDGAHQH